MNAKDLAYLKKTRPYRAWAYRHDGSKFIVHGKNRADVLDWGRRAHTKIGNQTTAGALRRKKRSAPRMQSFGFNPWSF